MGLLIIEVPDGRISCIERRINMDEWEVKPVSMTVMKEASDAMKRWQRGMTFCWLRPLMFNVIIFAVVDSESGNDERWEDTLDGTRRRSR